MPRGSMIGVGRRIGGDLVAGILGGFSPNIAGFLVHAESLESGLAEHVILRPFGKTDLGDQFRFDPMDTRAAGRVTFVERRAGLFKCIEAAAQVEQGFMGEAAAYLAGVNQGLAVWFVVADQ